MRAGRAVFAVRLAATAVVLRRLATGADRRPAIDPAGPVAADPISVVVPARDEAARIGPCVEALVADPTVDEVIVVDDESSDGTASIARALGATVVHGAPLPAGWAGKPWALRQGIDAAANDWIVTLDADTRPGAGLAGVAVAAAQRAGVTLLTLGGRFDCRTFGEQLLHPAMLMTLVYRFGPPGRASRPSRTLANGQCMVIDRGRFAAAGGFDAVASSLVEDVAIARHLARCGEPVAFEDGSRLFDVRMHTDARRTWQDWGRSLSLAEVTAPSAQLVDLAVVWATLGLPALRLLTRRADRLDVGLLALRLAMTAAIAPAYRHRGPAHWMSPLADPAVAWRLTQTTLRPERTWRGRTYPAR